MAHAPRWLCVVVVVVSGCGERTAPPAAPARTTKAVPPETPKAEESDQAPGRPLQAEDLERLERELKIQLPTTYREFTLKRSGELLGYTYPLRGETRLWFDSLLFGFDVDRMISENTSQREPEWAAAEAFPGWWREYFLFGTNGGGDYYAVRLDGTPGVWFLNCETAEKALRAKSLDEFVTDSLQDYESDLAEYRQLEALYQQKVRGDITEAEFDKQWDAIVSEP